MNYTTNPKELFNLRYSSLRVTVERAFEALKNRSRIIDTMWTMCGSRTGGWSLPGVMND
jgi:hypothetical protein